MKAAASRTILAFLCFYSFIAFADAPVTKENCDIVGSEMSSLKAKSPAECAARCQATKGCGYATYISGWGRCFLKRESKREVAVRMVSGERGDTGFTVREQHDNSGKDFKRLALSGSDACQTACEQENACLGFTFIAGYDTCWLKKSKGKLYSKTFYCIIIGDQPTGQ